MVQSRLSCNSSQQADLSVQQLGTFADNWLQDCEVRSFSKSTLQNRRIFVDKLIWFLRRKEYTSCGLAELRAFFFYLQNGHKEPGGRWGKADETKPVSRSTVETYRRAFHALFAWIIEETESVVLDRNPVARIKVAKAGEDQITPFTFEQVQHLIATAQRTDHSARDSAIVHLLFDTGMRANELCCILMRDIDLTGRRVIVHGKGDKDRTLPFSKTTAKALWAYLKDSPRTPADPLFISERGYHDPLTRDGLTNVIKRLGQRAGITSVRVSPHTFRHTYAIEYLRAGGNVFSLQISLGHSKLEMTQRYSKIAQADVENQHRLFSPVEAMKRASHK